jgi:hypothetical protein
VRISLKNDQPYGKYDLYTYLPSTIGIMEMIYSGKQDANWYPPSGTLNYAAEEYADAIFSKTASPSVTAPPTVVPELPIQAAPLVAVMALVAAVMILRKASRGVRRTDHEIETANQSLLLLHSMHVLLKRLVESYQFLFQTCRPFSVELLAFFLGDVRD